MLTQLLQTFSAQTTTTCDTQNPHKGLRNMSKINIHTLEFQLVMET